MLCLAFSRVCRVQVYVSCGVGSLVLFGALQKVRCIILKL